MTRFNELGRQEYARAIRQFFEMEEGEVAAVASEVMPVFDLLSRIEQWRLLGGAPCGINQSVAAVALQFGWVSARNPPNSGLLWTIEYVIPLSAQVFIWSVRSEASPLLTVAGSSGVITLDGRDGFTGRGLIAAFGNQVANPAGLTFMASTASAIDQPFPVNVVLSPGTELVCSSSVVAAGANAQFLGRYRIARSDELLV